MKSNNVYQYESPIGSLLLQSDIDNNNIVKILYADIIHDYIISTEKKPKIIDILDNELSLYFNGSLKKFTVKFLIEGTTFQKEVYKAAIDIAYAETVTYKDLANKINNEKASRAVGMALSKNQINIIIPCHRIIGSASSPSAFKLVGYTGGLHRKKKLLEIENPSYHNF